MKPLSIIASLLFTSLLCGSVFVTSCTPREKCYTSPVCKNGGICYKNTCMCPTGFEGNDCSYDQRDRFVGTWTQNDNGSSQDDFTITILKAHDAPQVAVQHFDNRAANTVFGFVTDQHTVTFATETVKGYMLLTIDGNTYSDKVMTLNYDITDSAGNIKTVMTRLDRQ